jgi:hypothetical protein
VSKEFYQPAGLSTTTATISLRVLVLSAAQFHGKQAFSLILFHILRRLLPRN